MQPANPLQPQGEVVGARSPQTRPATVKEQLPADTISGHPRPLDCPYPTWMEVAMHDMRALGPKPSHGGGQVAMHDMRALGPKLQLDLPRQGLAYARVGRDWPTLGEAGTGPR